MRRNESRPAHPRLGCAGPLFVLTFWSAPRDRLRCRAGPRRTVLPTPRVQRKHRIGRLGPPPRGTAWWRVHLYGEARSGGVSAGGLTTQIGPEKRRAVTSRVRRSGPPLRTRRRSASVLLYVCMSIVRQRRCIGPEP